MPIVHQDEQQRPAKNIFSAIQTIATLKDTSEKMNQFTASKGGMAARYGGQTTRSPSMGESMATRYGGNSTTTMVKIKTYEEFYTGKFSVSRGILHSKLNIACLTSNA